MRRLSRAALTAILVAVATPMRAGWVDDWVNSATVTPMGRFDTQRRGYFSGGGVAARWRTASEYPFTVSLPRINAGCGGIDAFLGGFSFMDPEYLVQKFQRTIQAAPAVAFDIALKELTKELPDSVKRIISMADQINQIQVNECAIAKRVVAEVSSDDPQILSGIWEEISGQRAEAEGATKNYHQTNADTRAADGRPPVDLAQSIAGCPADFREIFGGGSVIRNAAQRLSMDAFENVIRGYVGDLIVDWDSGLPRVRRIDRCAENQRVDADDFLDGRAQARNLAGACYLDSGTRLRQQTVTTMTAIADRVRVKGNLTAAQLTFVEGAGLPVYAVLKAGVESRRDDDSVGRLSDAVARGQAWRVLRDLYESADWLVTKAGASVPGGPDVGGAPQNCTPQVLAGAVQPLLQMRGELHGLMQASRAAYVQSVNELLAFMRVAAEEQALRDDDSGGRWGRGEPETK